MRVLAIDPGTTQSAYVEYDGTVVSHGISENSPLCERLASRDYFHVSFIVVEQIESFGMSVGKEVFETVWWAGRFHQAAQQDYVVSAQRMTRREVKLHLCKSMKAKDANIRQALIDRFGGEKAIGLKKSPGPLYGIRSHEWAALAIAVCWWDLNVTKAGM